MKIQISRITNTGNVRTHNEDNYVLILPDYREKAFDDSILEMIPIQDTSQGIFLSVIDGMGGMGNGDIASQTIAERIFFTWKDLAELPPEEIPNGAMLNAHEFIRLVVKKNPQYMSMGAVATSCYIRESTVWVSQVGDTRLYHFHDNIIDQITIDQTLVNALLKSGRITREQLNTHPERHIVTQAIGPQKLITPENYKFEVKEGDKILLCSDGLTGMVDDENIKEILQKYSNNQCVEELVSKANQNGGEDNITVVLAEFFPDNPD